MKPEFELFDRREFFGVVTKTAAIIGLAGGTKGGAEGQGTANPFAYDISRFRKPIPNSSPTRK
jgi:hypothetical protein